MNDFNDLLQKARTASGKAYAPYSKFPVGAAVLFSSGKVYTGVNVENRSFGLTICAERSAIVSGISRGENEILAVAVYCPAADYPVSPCGACRQVISEFAKPGCDIIFMDGKGHKTACKIEELFPFDALKELSQ